MKTEIDKLQDWLIKNHIQHERGELLGGDQILVKHNHLELSFICHMGSYGHERGLIEMWDFINDPEGWLTAEKCKRIIKKRVGFNKKTCRV